jgi:hypothetical protein
MNRCEAWERVSWVNDGDEGIKNVKGKTRTLDSYGAGP